MKYIKWSYIIILSVASVFILILGVLRKITHFPDADFFMKVSLVSLIVSGILAISKFLFSNHKSNTPPK